MAQPQATPADIPFRTVEISDPAFERDGLRHVTVRSPALGRRADVTVWLPEAGPADGRPLPLVILLHGVYGSHWAWAGLGGAHLRLAAMIAEGRCNPMALAMPSDGLWGDGSGYLPRPGEDAEAWVVQEVPRVVQLLAPEAAKGGVGVAGLSMGGYGALRLAALHPQWCAAAAAVSPITRRDQLRHFVAEPLDAYPEVPNSADVGELLAAAGTDLPPLLVACGTEDPLLGASRALHTRLDHAGVAHVYLEGKGGHSWSYWSATLPAVVEFMDRCFAARSPARSKGA